MASKTRMTAHDKQLIAGIFEQDMGTITEAMRSQLQEAWDYSRELILRRNGIKEMIAEAQNLDREIKDKRDELQRIREQLTHEIALLESKLAALKRESLGEWDGPAEPARLRELGFNEDESIKKREWMGFPIRSKLDVETALALKFESGVEAPAKVVMDVFKAVQREFTFCSSYEDAAEVYKKFYGLNFKQYGIDIPPRLDELQRLTGRKLLEVGIELDESKRLPAGPAQLPKALPAAPTVGFKLDTPDPTKGDKKG